MNNNLIALKQEIRYQRKLLSKLMWRRKNYLNALIEVNKQIRIKNDTLGKLADLPAKNQEVYGDV